MNNNTEWRNVGEEIRNEYKNADNSSNYFTA